MVAVIDAACLELRQDVDDSILRCTVVVVGSTSKMGVDYRIAVDDMDMRKESDTGIVAEENQQKTEC